MEQLKLNMIPNGVNPVFHASQYDKGRQIRFVLDETLSGAEVTVSYRAKDGTEHGNVQTSVSGNTITDTIPEEVLTDYGIIEGEVNIDGIGSLNFFVEVEKDAYDGGVITTQTASGPIATFNTNMVEPFKSLKSDINPVQDLHGYSKPWSGGGGKNKLNYLNNLRASSSGLTIEATTSGAIHYEGTATQGYCLLTFPFNLSIPSGTTITVSRDVSVGYQHYFSFTFTDNSVEYVRIMPNTTSTTYTLAKDLKNIDIICLGLAVGTAYNATVKFQLEYGSQATSWEPYENICPISGFSALNVTLADGDMQTVESKTVNFGQTVYGGVADVTNGKVNVTHKFVTLNGSEAWGSLGSIYTLSLSDMESGTDLDGITNYMQTVHGSAPVDIVSIRFGYNSKVLYVYQANNYLSGVSDLASFKTYLSDNPLEVCYPLATPIEITTTPENLTAVSGENNVFADTNGDTTVEYYIEV